MERRYLVGSNLVRIDLERNYMVRGNLERRYLVRSNLVGSNLERNYMVRGNLERQRLELRTMNQYPSENQAHPTINRGVTW